MDLHSPSQVAGDYYGLFLPLHTGCPCKPSSYWLLPRRDLRELVLTERCGDLEAFVCTFLPAEISATVINSSSFRPLFNHPLPCSPKVFFLLLFCIFFLFLRYLHRFTFHFPGDSAVVHFTVTPAVQTGVLFVKRRVSCLLCSRNQRGNTESIRLWREGTNVVHRQLTESL